MSRSIVTTVLATALAASLSASSTACTARESDSSGAVASDAPAATSAGQAAVQDDESIKNIVQIAVGSADHSTLVAALKATNLVDPLANPGPFTVFAPTNAAFDKLPPGTVDNLLKPENLGQLKTILHHHVTTSALDLDALTDGQSLGMVDGTREVIRKGADGTFIGDARIVATVRASNGVVHVIDAVVLPK
jgi:uncharacterized surface protein with fasciclin (FAS1) repeats